MKQIQKDIGFESFEEVLFFDDDHNNIISTNTIGVVAVQIDQETGLHMNVLKSGLSIFENKKKRIK